MGKDVLPEKDLLEKADALKRFNSALGKELKAQTSAAEKQYQKLDKVFDSNKKGENQFIFWANLCLVCSKDFTFYKYHNINEFDDTKEIKPNNEAQKKRQKKENLWLIQLLNLYDKLSNMYTTQYNKLTEDLNRG